MQTTNPNVYIILVLTPTMPRRTECDTFVVVLGPNFFGGAHSSQE